MTLLLIISILAVLVSLVWLHDAGNKCFSPYEREFQKRRSKIVANVYTKILHSVTYREDGKTVKSDKVFIIEVNNINDTFFVTATWGKRLAPRLNSLVLDECRWELAAISTADRFVKAKKENKDKYVEAPTSLVIPGFKKYIVSAVETRADSVINEPKVTVMNHEPLSRNIKV